MHRHNLCKELGELVMSHFLISLQLALLVQYFSGSVTPIYNLFLFILTNSQHLEHCNPFNVRSFVRRTKRRKCYSLGFSPKTSACKKTKKHSLQSQSP